MKTTVKQKIELLESQGYKVHLKHQRRLTKPAKFSEPPKLDPMGGWTEVYIKEGESQIAYTVAECSGEDNYNKKIGANIALGRALKELNL